MPIRNTKNRSDLIVLAVVVAMMINPIFDVILIIILFFFFSKKIISSLSLGHHYQTQVTITDLLAGLLKKHIKSSADVRILEKKDQLIIKKITRDNPSAVEHFLDQKKLVKNKKYLHIALNSTLEEAKEIISQLPSSDRILIEAGTPLIKIYGATAISQIKELAPAGTYIVADNKCADLATREVEMMANAGASAATCLGVAPIETIDVFIEECRKFNIDSMIDMMNVENALAIMKKLKKLPDVVILHRGVDESEFSKEKQIPYYQIKQIKGNYNILVAIAGGDTIKEVQRAIFNDADIVVVWKDFYQASTETAQLAELFLKEIK
jgi:3-keto-L-gulonate-6-phosphate decarboxylase